MTDLRTAALRALEAWEYINKYGFVLADYEGPMEQAITALKAALEKPEPVAWTTMPDADDWMFVSGTEKPPLPGEWHPLYTHPPRREWRGLKNQELYGLLRQSGVTSYLHQDDRMQGAFERCLEAYSRLIEAKMKELNHA
jgi:hypothetical protein